MIEVQSVLSGIQQAMTRAIEHLEAELSKIRAGRASTQMLDGIHVDYYGASTPLSQVANVSTPDARTLSIQPWEKSMITPIEKAITAANLGFNPQNDGMIIRIIVPPLTEERRRELVKKTKTEGEHARITIRNLRRDANEMIKKEIKNHLPEDVAKEAETKVQHLTDSFIQKIDKHLETKEKEIMTV